jgi:predicted GNAT family acetyltransferase
VQLTAFAGPAEFLREIEPEVGAREVEYHLLLGLARAAEPKPDAVFLTMRDDRGLALAAFMTPPRPLLIAAPRSDADRSLAELARWLAANKRAPRGCLADVPVAETFVREWAGLTGAAPKLRMRQRQFVLRRVSQVAMTPGVLRPATVADLDLLERWMGAFHAEAMGETVDPELRDAIARRVRAGALYLWEQDGEPRSMAASARPTAHGIAINSVYTPPALRGRGFATTCVAALSQRMLDAGRRFCVLFTDLANPTSNAIYARIGYRPVADSALFELGPVS